MKMNSILHRSLITIIFIHCF